MGSKYVLDLTKNYNASVKNQVNMVQRYCYFNLYTARNAHQFTAKSIAGLLSCHHQACIRMCLHCLLCLLIINMLQVVNRLDASWLSRLLSTSLTLVVSAVCSKSANIKLNKA